MTEQKTTDARGASPSHAGLAACPCGKTPDTLIITDAGQGGKWAMVCGNCCGDWMIEFRTGYNPLESDECERLARDAWNAARRVANA